MELHKFVLFTGRPDVLLFHLRHQVWRVNPHDRRDHFRSCMNHGSYLVAKEKQMGWQRGSTKGMKFWVSSCHVALMHYDTGGFNWHALLMFSDVFLVDITCLTVIPLHLSFEIHQFGFCRIGRHFWSKMSQKFTQPLLV